jgi:hypothetical protein
MTAPAPSPTAYYTAAEVASALRCSAWWVKDQARRRRIPYCWVARSYRFTDEHMAEIQRLLERRPTVPAEPSSPATPSAPPARRDTSNRADPTIGLRARPPRRSGQAAPTSELADAA